ncbi:unnamed protein product [Urochloa decumbens]|uniref:KIB1-4 beta-propeller domain-containing protein n=1 Tax=Urochloa decumbens TaxID=240449 RepID=A0ABC8VKY4_9POAL
MAPRKARCRRRRGKQEEERPWRDLPADVVSQITNAREMSLVDYTSIRGVCWRSSMPPATPLLIYTAYGPGHAAYEPELFAAAFSLPAQRRLDVRGMLDPVLTTGSVCVGSGHGWIAVDERIRSPYRRLILTNPISGVRIRLPELLNVAEWEVKKVVFAPNPTEADFTAVAIYGRGNDWNVAYARSGDEDWTEVKQDYPRQCIKNTIVDLVYHDDGRVYCLTLASAVRVICIPAPGGGGGEAPKARVESLLPEGNGSLPFDPARVFAVKRFKFLFDYLRAGHNERYLVFCEGVMYQVWRNLVNIRRAVLFGGLEEAELGKEIIVLKHDPGSWPCWKEVHDLGGYSLFLGKNNAVSVRVAGTPGLRGNCVYWIGGPEEETAMVFDMATQITTLCVPNGSLEGFHRWASCWYFLK